MPLTVSFNMVQVIDIAEAEDRLLDLYNTILIAREKGLRGRDLKPIVQAWVEERLAEAGA